MAEIGLRATREDDLDDVLAMESDPDAAPFIIGWSPDRHREALTDPDQAHMAIVDGAGFLDSYCWPDCPTRTPALSFGELSYLQPDADAADERSHSSSSTPSNSSAPTAFG